MNSIQRFLIGVALVALATPAIAADTLVIGNEGTYPPFSMMTADGKVTGIEPDLAREMCSRMKADCDIKVMDFQALIPALLQGRLGAIGSQLTPLPERKAKMLFTTPIIFNHDAFVVRKDSTVAFTKEGLKGTRIGVQRGTPQAKYITENFAGSVTPSLYDNPEQMKLDLLAGRLDMVFGASLNWTASLIDTPDGKNWKMSDFTVWTGDPTLPAAEQGSSWAVPKGKEAVVEKMNAALKNMIADCTFTTIRAKYLSTPISPDEAACITKKS
ncbi:transporter substrate-binding domain-containing protein [Azospirillum canadense]|uniref:transporter substrate-binding domain-containing protein n=1 Tax=Azospirillum canadense TaxID=403962 RepID=UPI00222690E3|nr:transporter substrate-binding domain-containing protein [Azospirillum canadense]MCW2238860.1 ABC-type amino acid transport substrate-binding protein [Azospirillum canadense]